MLYMGIATSGKKLFLFLSKVDKKNTNIYSLSYLDFVTAQCYNLINVRLGTLSYFFHVLHLLYITDCDRCPAL